MGGGRAELVAGVDGCRSGWVVAVTAAVGPAPVLSIDVVDHIGVVLDRVRAGELAAVGLDMPFGLPDVGPPGVRHPDQGEARPPTVVGLPDTSAPAPRQRRPRRGRGAGSGARRAGHLDPGVQPPPQDRRGRRGNRPPLAERVVEAHPESAFAELAGAPLPTTKRTAEGRAARFALLAEPFPDSKPLLLARLAGAAPDDVLDAVAAAWSARRWAAGTALVLGDGTLDRRGLPMRVAI